jgi:cell division transport system permease protein
MSAPSVLAPRLEALGEALRRIGRQPLRAVLTLMLTAAALTLALAGATLALSLAGPWQQLNAPAQAVVFVAASARSAEIGTLRSRALEIAGVAAVEHPSREAALAELARRTPGGTPAELRASALPETLLVRFAGDIDPATAEAAAAALRKLPRADLVQFDADVYRRWHGMRRLGGMLGMAVAITVLALCAGLLVLLPGPLAATSAQEGQLRALLGATPAEIRRPGAYAGAVFGAMAALLAIAALLGGLRVSEPVVAALPAWAGAPIVPTLPSWPMLAAVVVGCALLAGASGAAAARAGKSH